MLSKIKTEVLGLIGDLWKSARGLLASHTTLAAVSAIAAPHLCAIAGCDAIKTEHTIAVFLGWAVKQASKEFGAKRAAAEKASQ